MTQIKLQSASFGVYLRLFLIDDPGVAAINQLLEAAWSGLRDRGIDLIDHHVLVSRALDRSEDADRLRKLRLLHARQHESYRRIFLVHIVNQQIVFGDAVFANRHDFRQGAVHANTLVAILSENHWLAVFEVEHSIGPNRTLGEVVKGAVVE